MDSELRNVFPLQGKTVVIFGSGNVGETAAKTCSILGARAIMVEKKRYVESTLRSLIYVLDNRGCQLRCFAQRRYCNGRNLC